MTNLTPSIAEDIQMLVDLALDNGIGDAEVKFEHIQSALHVQNYLSTFKPDHL